MNDEKLNKFWAIYNILMPNPPNYTENKTPKIADSLK